VSLPENLIVAVAVRAIETWVTRVWDIAGHCVDEQV
jgi:hypothetical protein